MASQLEDELCRIKHCLGVCGYSNIVNTVPVDNWTVEWPMIAKNEQHEIIKTLKENRICY